MHLVPLRDDLLFPLEQTFNKFFDDFFSSKSNINQTRSNLGYPKMNCFSNENSFCIQFAVPGMEEEDINLVFNEDNSITISGKMSSEHKNGDKTTYYVREVRQSHFERTVKLPDTVVGPPSKAELKSGLLKLSWDLKPPERKDKKKIAIEKK